MGVRQGGAILLMADMTRLAWAYRKAGQRFTADMLLNAFLEHLGPAGTLVVPTFNYDLQPGEAFDIRRTPTISGALGQAAMAHHAFKRTAQPLHSFAVAGARQGEFLKVEDPSSFGPRSAFALLHAHGFQLLAIDMPLEPAFTYVHFVEESMQVKYRKWKGFPIRYTDKDGHTSERTFKLFAKKPGHVNDFKALGPVLMEAPDVMQKGHVQGSGYINIHLARAHAVIEEEILNNNARRIVKFKVKWWLRDILRPFLKRARPSRSAQLLSPHAARSH